MINIKLVRIKQKIIEKINKNGNSILNPLKIKKHNALKEIFNDTKNSRNKYKNLLLDGGFYNLGYFYRLQLIRSALKLVKLKNMLLSGIVISYIKIF